MDVLEVGDRVGSIVAAIFTVASFVISLIVLARQVYPADPWKPFRKTGRSVKFASRLLFATVVVGTVVAGYVLMSWKIMGWLGLDGDWRLFVAVFATLPESIIVPLLLINAILDTETPPRAARPRRLGAPATAVRSEPSR